MTSTTATCAVPTRTSDVTDLGYHMIESDWLILDNMTFNMELCLDHYTRRALNAYLVNDVLGSPTRILTHWDPVANKHVAGAEQVKIPRHQAQQSLVSSMGMTVNPNLLGLAQHGTSVLDCDKKSWHSEGGSEFVSRITAITSTQIEFKHQIHAPQTQFGVHDDLHDDHAYRWKAAVKGVFTTTIPSTYLK